MKPVKFFPFSSASRRAQAVLAANRNTPGRPARRGKAFRSLLTSAAFGGLMFALPTLSYAAPSGGTVVAGDAAISNNGNVTTINQLSQKAVIDWLKFGIKSDEMVNFFQPGASSVILNRVTGNEATAILGALTANGNVFIVNPNGILFGAGARVDVAGLMATTMNIRNEDFMAGNYNFAQDAAAKLAYVINEGTIKIGENGFAYLAAPGVQNSGIIVAKSGQVALGSGTRAYVDFSGKGLVKFSVSGKVTEQIIGPDGKPMSAAVANTGAIKAEGGHVILSADAARDVVTSVVNNTGVIEATSLEDIVGSVALVGRGEGNVVNSGTIRVASDVAGTNAGSVAMTGENVGQFGTVNADAAQSGSAGTVNLHATNVVALTDGSVTTANAGTEGNGGKILVIGEDSARVSSTAVLQARGGSAGGNGGFIETSGYKGFEIGATPDVSAPAGLAGTWLLDPANIEIKSVPFVDTNSDLIPDDYPSVNMDESNPFVSTAGSAVLSIQHLLAALNGGNVVVTTGNVGTEPGNITLTDALVYSGGNSLTLNAHNNIILNADITFGSAGTPPLVPGTIGGTLTLNAGSNAGGGTGNTDGSIFLNANITTNGGAFTTTGKNLTQATGKTVSTGGGNISIGNTGAVAFNGNINAGAGSIGVTGADGINVGGNITSTGTVSLTALTGSIYGAGTVTADTLNLTTLGTVNADIGTIGQKIDGSGNVVADLTPLKVSASTVNASTKSGLNADGVTTTGNIVLESTGATFTLGTITTNGDKGDTDLAGVYLTAKNGSIALADPNAKIAAYYASFTAAGDIELNTDVSVLSLSTTDSGSITINNSGTGGLLLLGATAREYGNVAMIDTNQDVKVINGAGAYVDGTKNISITAAGDIGIQGAVSSAAVVTITSTAGSIYNVPLSAAMITSRELNLNAGESVGLFGGNLNTLTGALINATAGTGGVYLSENNRLNIGTITAGGFDNPMLGGESLNPNSVAVYLVSSGGNAYFSTAASSITATGSGAVVAIDVGNKIVSAPGGGVRITADGVHFKAAAVGSATGAVSIDAAKLKTNITVSGGGTYVANAGSFTGLDITTLNGIVSAVSAGANLSYAANGLLTLTNGTGTGLKFTNANGAVSLGGINVGTNEFSLTAASVTQTGASLLIAGKATLNSGGSIGQSGTRLQTQVGELVLTSGKDGIYVDQQGALTLDAAANGTASDIDIRQTGTGDLRLVKAISAKGGVKIVSGGAIQGTVAGATHVSGTSVSLTAAGGIGAVGDTALGTRINLASGTFGALNLSANGDVLVKNSGDAILDIDTAGVGKINVATAGAVKLNVLNAGSANDINFTAGGAITDNNGDTLNITGNNLVIKAPSVGTVSDALEMNVSSINVEATTGSVGLKQTGTGALQLINVTAPVDVSVETGGDLSLGTVRASNNVVIKAAGVITDGRAPGTTAPNVKAATLSLQADSLGSELKLDVQVLDSGIASGIVDIVNTGSLHVTKESLEGKGNQRIALTATGITVFDNKGGTTALDLDGSLELTATAGNIVFLNSNDTVQVSGAGHITLKATGTSLPVDPETGLVQETGLVGVIIAGNLVTAGGNITLEATSHISINTLDAGTGDVRVKSDTGVILDGNGAANNIVAKNVYLQGKSPLGADSATLDYNTAEADATNRAHDVTNLQRERDHYRETVDTYDTQVKLFAQLYENSLAEVARTNADLSSAEKTALALQATFEALGLAFDVANTIVTAMEIPAGAAQAIPLAGDGGSEMSLAIAKLALDAAATAVNAAEVALGHALDDVDGIEKTLIGQEANLYTNEQLLNDNQVKLGLYTKLFKETEDKLTESKYALDASQKIFDLVAKKVYDNAKLTGEGNVIGLKTQALGVQAERVDAYALGQSSIYITSPNGLGAGNVNAAGVDTTVQLTAMNGNLGVLGEISASKDVFLYSSGAITGSAAGKVTTKDLVAVAGNGIGMAVPINAKVERIAASGGTSGAKFINDNGTEALTIDAITVSCSAVPSVTGVTGVTGAGDILIQTTDNLVINAGIADTTGSSIVTLTATDGSITGADSLTRHVSGGTLVATAADGIGTDSTPLRTDVVKLTGDVTVAGLINIDEKDAIELTSLHTENGSVNVRAGGSIDAVSVISETDAAANTVTLTATAGDITAHTITAGTTEGVITLTSALGQVNNDADTATKITGRTLNISAATGIGVTGTADAHRSLDTVVTDLTAVTTTGPINISEADALNIKNAVTGNGNITIVNAAGDLNVTNIAANTTDNTVTLKAVGAITDATGNETAAIITAKNLIAIAGTGIGTSTNFIEVNIDNLAASTTSGGIYINDLTGSLTVTGILTPGLSTVTTPQGVLATAGDIVLTTAENMTLNSPVNATAGNVTLTATAGSMTSNAPVTAGNGNVTMLANVDILVNANAAVLASKNVSMTATTGDITTNSAVTAQGSGADPLDGSVTMTAGTAGTGLGSITTNSAVTAQDGDVRMLAEKDIFVSTGAAVTASANVIMIATTGDITTNSTVTAQGSGADPLDGSVTMAAGIAGTDLGSITTNSAVTAQDGDVTMLAEKDVFVSTGAAVTASANVIMIATTGGITTNSTVTATTDDVTMTAANDVTLNADVTASAGNVFVTSNDESILINATVTASTAANDATIGTVTLSAAKGAITGRDANPPAYHVVANKFDATAKNGIGTELGNALRTNIAEIDADVTGTGNVNIAEKDALVIENITTANGSITVVAGGQIDAKNVVSTTDDDANDISLTATSGDIIVYNIVAGAGEFADAKLVSDNGRVYTYRGTPAGNRLVADVLTVEAETYINLDTTVNRADLTVQGNASAPDLTTTDAIVIDEADDLIVDNAEAQGTGNIDIKVTGTGDIHVNYVRASVDDVIIEATAGNIYEYETQDAGIDIIGDVITLTATGAIGKEGTNPDGTSQAIEINGNTLNATAGSIYLDEADSIALAGVSAANGTVQINAANAITNDGVDTNTVTAKDLVLSAGTGIGTGANGALDIAAETLTASAAAGNINIDQTGDITVLNATAAAGDITLNAAGNIKIDTIVAGTPGDGHTATLGTTAGGAVTNNRTDGLANITADNIDLTAAGGVGTPAKALVIDAAALDASGGTGGINVSNLRAGLDLGRFETTAGDLTLTTIGQLVIDTPVTNGGNITFVTLDNNGAANDYIIVNAAIASTGGGSVTLTADDSVLQNADITVNGKGNVTVTAGESIIMDPGATTTADKGTITYKAGDTLELGRLIANNTPPGGGTVAVDAPTIINHNPDGTPAIEADTVKVTTNLPTDSGQDGKALLEELIGGIDKSSTIYINGRVVGGTFSRDMTYIWTPRNDSAIFDLEYRLLREGTGYETLPIESRVYTPGGFIRREDSDEWIFTSSN